MRCFLQPKLSVFTMMIPLWIFFLFEISAQSCFIGILVFFFYKYWNISYIVFICLLYILEY